MDMCAKNPRHKEMQCSEDELSYTSHTCTKWLHIYIYMYIYILFLGGPYWFPIFHVSNFMFPFEGGKAPVEEPILSKFYHDDRIFYHDDRKFYQHDRILISAKKHWFLHQFL